MVVGDKRGIQTEDFRMANKYHLISSFT